MVDEHALSEKVELGSERRYEAQREALEITASTKSGILLARSTKAGYRVAWERRGDGLYYYQSERENGRVRKRYVGRGEVAQLVAHADEARRAERERRRRDERAELERSWEISEAGAELDAAAEVLARAQMVAAGYHNHKGEWRRRRNA